MLGWKYGLASTAIYILLGAVGVPVFAGFSGGLSFAVSPAGGYIWGFLPMVALCGLGYEKRNIPALVCLSVAGLAACHILGVIQLGIVTGLGPLAAFMAGSAPYLVKDLVSLAAAYVVAKVIRRALSGAGVQMA